MSAIRFILVLLALQWLWNQVRPCDDTDPPGGRSGLALHTDARTGCQYVGATYGGATPRGDGQGRQMGCRQ